MKTLHVTMTVKDIREAIVGKKIRIRRMGDLLTADFREVLRVDALSMVIQFDNPALCRVAFADESYKFIHQGDVIEVLEKTDDSQGRGDKNRYED